MELPAASADMQRSTGPGSHPDGQNRYIVAFVNPRGATGIVAAGCIMGRPSANRECSCKPALPLSMPTIWKT